MKRSFVLWLGSLEKLIEDDNIVNIILGTGTLARDMQTKLKLLNLKAPILVGDKHNPDNGIWHYEKLSDLENPKKCRFISCFDTDEWTLISPVLSLVYKMLGATMWNHPNVLRYYDIWRERVGKPYVDAHIQETYLHNEKPYIVLGDINDKTALKIHFLGACPVSGIYKITEYVVPELLYKKLHKEGFNATIYIWGHPLRTTYDSLTLFLRDVYKYSPAHIISSLSVFNLNPVNVIKNNSLSVRTGSSSHLMTQKMRAVQSPIISNGVHHDTDPNYVSFVHNKTFLLLAKLYGFSFWSVVFPSSSLLNEEQAHRLRGLSSGYFKRSKKRKDDFISLLDSSSVKDYTGAFDGAEDIFSLYMDSQHWSDVGNNIVAQKLADDILKEFPSYRK